MYELIAEISVIFIVGVIFGAFISSGYYRKKYRKIAHDSIAEVHRTYSDVIPTKMEELR